MDTGQSLLSASVYYNLTVSPWEHKIYLNNIKLFKSHFIKVGNRPFENVAQFRYFGTTVPNQNLVQEENKRRLNSGNACYHSVWYVSSSRLLSKNVEIVIHTCTKLQFCMWFCIGVKRGILYYWRNIN
jgi:hypothetical protein